MNILIDIGHPAHVHLFRNLYFELLKKNHSIFVTIKDNLIVAKDLLNHYNIPFYSIGWKSDNILSKAILQVQYNINIAGIIKKKHISIGLGSSITLAHASKITKMNSIILDDDDDEVEPLFTKYAHPFCDVILSPEALKGHRKKKDTVFYNGNHELAYLHPKRFAPEKNVLRELGMTEKEKYFILRFNSFKAHHDVEVRGLSVENKRKLIEVLKPHGKIFITTERLIDEEYEEYKIKIEAHKIHSFLSYATMFIGDSQTMTSEAAVMGIPAIRSNSLVGKISYLEEEEHKYGLTFGYKPDEIDRMFGKIDELLKMPNLKEEWQKRKQKMLSDKIDVTAFLVWFVENYPQSHQIMKENSDYQYNFK